MKNIGAAIAAALIAPLTPLHSAPAFAGEHSTGLDARRTDVTHGSRGDLTSASCASLTGTASDNLRAVAAPHVIDRIMLETTQTFERREAAER